MAGHDKVAEAACPSAAQCGALARAEVLASEVPPPVESQKAALSALLRSEAGYEQASGVGDVAVYKQGSVSLPSDVSDAPSVFDISPGSTLRHLEDFDGMLRPLSELQNLDDTLGRVEPYMDPVLGSDRRQYLAFLEDLDRRGLLTWSQNPKVLCSVFFVRKKPSSETGADLRMIIDCRPANRRISDPPNTVLASPESLSSLEVDHADTLYTSTVDVRDCFYRIRVPDWFAEYFALPPIDAADISSTRGRFAGRVFPCIAALPMGFTWSLYIAQEINRARVVASGMPAESEVNAHSIENTFRLHSTRFIVYVDNIAVFGRDREEVDRVMGKIICELNRCKLLTHEHTPADTQCELLGMFVDGEKKEIRMTSKRFWRIRWGLEWMLRKGKVRGRLLEKIIGHVTFAALLNRNALSVTHTVYKFIRKHYDSPALLWYTVRRELETLLGLLPTLRTSFVRAWDGEVYAADACESGFGVVTSHWPPTLVASIGRINERSRFRMQKGGKSAREHAARSAQSCFGDTLKHHDTVWSAEVPQHCPDDWSVAPDFPEIPRAKIEDTSWSVVCSRHYRYSEAIHLKEARAINWSARRTTKSLHTHFSKRLLLCDNMSVVLSFERRRAHVFALLRQVRLFAALNMASGIHFCIRWIPSEANPSDLPSRRFENPEMSREFDIDNRELQLIFRERYSSHVVFDKDVEEWVSAEGILPQPARILSERSGFNDGEVVSQTPATVGSAPRSPGRSTQTPGEIGPPPGLPPPHTSVLDVFAEETFDDKPQATSEPLCGDMEGPLASCSAVRHCPQRRTAKVRGARYRHVDGVRRGRQAETRCPGEEAAAQILETEYDGLNPGWRRRYQCPRERADAVQSARRSLLQGFPESAPERVRGVDSRRAADGLPEHAIHHGPRQPSWRPAGRSLVLPPPDLQPYAPGSTPRGTSPSERSPSATPPLEEPTEAVGSDGHDELGDGSDRSFGKEELGTGVLLESPKTMSGGEAEGGRDQFRVNADPGLEGDAVVQGIAAGAPWRRTEPVAVGVQLCGLGARLEEYLQQAEVARLCTLSAQAQQSFTQPRDANASTEDRAEHQAAALVEVRQGGRRTRQASARGKATGGGDAELRAVGSRESRGSRRRKTTTSRPAARRPAMRFLDAFGGVGGVTAECGKLGVTGTVYDFVVNPECDFRNRAFVRSVNRLVRRRHFVAGMFHTPCTTFCIARDRNSQIRTRDSPMGLPHAQLSEKQIQQLKDGNETMYATLRMIREFDRLGLPFIVENPQSSRLWLTPGFQALIAQDNVELVIFHMCQFGSKWKKPTTVLAGNIPSHLLDTLRKTCTGHNGICCRTNKKHLQLTGAAPCGKPWTAVAQVYPKGLCVVLAKLLTHQVVINA